MPEKDKRTPIIFNTVPSRKRAARILAAYLDQDDLTTLLNTLIDEKVAQYFPDLMKEIEAEDPKARRRWQTLKKAG